MSKNSSADASAQSAIVTRGFKELQSYLSQLHEQKTLRQIAGEDFGGRVNHATIDRAIKGIEPKRQDIREALGLSRIEYVRQVRGKDGRFS